MTNIDAAVERLNGCAEHLECNALNLEADTLDGDPNADFYRAEAAKQLQWSKDLRTVLSALATTQAELAQVKGELAEAVKVMEPFAEWADDPHFNMFDLVDAPPTECWHAAASFIERHKA